MGKGFQKADKVFLCVNFFIQFRNKNPSNIGFINTNAIIKVDVIGVAVWQESLK